MGTLRRIRLLSLAVAALAALLAPVVAAQGTTPSPGAATPSAGVVVESLLAVTYPAEALPDRAQILFSLTLMGPGAAYRHAGGTLPAGVGFDYVVAGNFAARSSGPMLVARTGETPDTAEPDVEVVLGPGDAAIYLDNTAALEGRAEGGEPLTLVTLFIGSLAPPAVFATPGLTGEIGGYSFGFLEEQQWADVAGGPVTATLERVTIPPGASLPAYAGSGWRLVGAEGRSFGAAGVLNEPLVNDGDTPLEVYVLTFVSAAASGTPEAATPAP